MANPSEIHPLDTLDSTFYGILFAESIERAKQGGLPDAVDFLKTLTEHERLLILANLVNQQVYKP